MNLFFSTCLVALAVNFISINTAVAQTSSAGIAHKKSDLKTYLIERDIPGAGQLQDADLKGISQKSCSVIKELGPGIVWLQSYITGDKIFCVYQASNELLLREHAKKGGFPITSASPITLSPCRTI